MKGLLIYMGRPGDYLVFYRVPQNAQLDTRESTSAISSTARCLGNGKGQRRHS